MVDYAFVFVIPFCFLPFSAVADRQSPIFFCLPEVPYLAIHKVNVYLRTGTILSCMYRQNRWRGWWSHGREKNISSLICKK